MTLCKGRSGIMSKSQVNHMFFSVLIYPAATSILETAAGLFKACH
jgi:hypothetical protein